MKIIKYIFEFVFILFFFLIFKILGYKLASNLGSKIGQVCGPLFRPKKRILSNIKKSLKNLNEEDAKNIVRDMWANYGRILSDYIFLKDFRNSNLDNFFTIEGLNILKKINNSNEPVIFISGHFNNFELMAMQIEKSGIKLATIYRPLNNIFLNYIMEKIRKKYICKNQLKKGIGGLKELIKLNKNGHSTALMIDQRVSQGIKSNFFNEKAFTTTIPAQLVKKFDIPIVPIFIERFDEIKFKIKIQKPVYFSKNNSTDSITERLNEILENMILKNPYNWIWSHNRWK